MQTVLNNAQGLSLLATLTRDRALCLGTVLLALLAGAGLGTLGVG